MSRNRKKIIIILLMIFIIFSLKYVLAYDFYIPDPVMGYNQTGNPYIVTGGAPVGNVNDLNIQGEGLTYDISEALVTAAEIGPENFIKCWDFGDVTSCYSSYWAWTATDANFLGGGEDAGSPQNQAAQNNITNQRGVSYYGNHTQTFNVNSSVINYLTSATLSFMYQAVTIDATSYIRIYLVRPDSSESLLWSTTLTTAGSWTAVSGIDLANNFTQAGDYQIKLWVNGVTGTAGGSRNFKSRWDDVNLTLNWNNPATYGVEVWHNSSQIADGIINYINATLNFTTNVSDTYSLQIYDWLNSQWTSTDCDSGAVSANMPTKWWCNMTSNPTNYNSSDRKVRIRINSTIDTDPGLLMEDYIQYFIGYPSYLEVNLTKPDTSSVFNVGQNQTFDVNSTVICRNGPCGEVFGTVMYNLSSTIPNIPVNTTQEDKPFYIKESPALAMKSCGTMYSEDICRLNWTINATGNGNSNWKIGVFFNSSYTDISSNRTDNATVSIFNCTEDFNVDLSYVNFGLLEPGSQQKPALGNIGNQYNISVMSGSCNLNLFIRGTDLENKTLNSAIGVENITWSNTSNSYSSSYNLTKTDQTVKLNAPKNTNVTTWYWINVPIIYMGYYNGTITITGVKVV